MAVDGGDKRKAKGVGKRVTKTLSHDDYKQRYLTRTELIKNIRRMQSFNHVIFNVTQAKVALSFMDNKRAWVAPNDSLPFGHYKLNRCFFLFDYRCQSSLHFRASLILVSQL